VNRTSSLALIVVLAALLASLVAPLARAQGPRVLLAEVTGPIDRSTRDYLIEAVDEARSRGYAALVVRFDTPGGALAETLEIASLFLQAGDIPVLGFVGPVGASSVSAGTILLEATDLAGMAPGTTIGSVQPVVIGPGGFEPITDSKVIEFVVAKLEEQMSLHGRNVSLARRFVVDNWNLNATEAQRLRATELVAASVPDLLAQADGRQVLVQSDGTTYKNVTLSLANAEIVPFAPSLRVVLVGLLSDPLLASLLLILGIYLVVFGLSAPGYGAEVAGVILILLALIGLGFSVNPIAILLLVIGIVLLIVELKTPGFGVFAIAGIIMIVLAAIFLAPIRPPDFVVSPGYQTLFLVSLLVPTGTFGGFLLLALSKVIVLRLRRPLVGEIVGETATATDPIPPGGRGFVQHRGELWQATSTEDIPAGATVYVANVDGITLTVSRTPPEVAAVRTWRDRLPRTFRRRPPDADHGDRDIRRA
jgi:membrane-bound serine protease (ClpP class)